MVSTWPSEPEGVRRKRDWVSISMLSPVLLLLLVVALGGIWLWWVEGEAQHLVVGVISSGMAVPSAFAVWRFIVDEYHNPTSSGVGWDWF